MVRWAAFSVAGRGAGVISARRISARRGVGLPLVVEAPALDLAGDAQAIAFELHITLLI